MNTSKTTSLAANSGLRPRRADKTSYLAINQIADLIAQAVVNEHQLLKSASSSQIYATDRDEFLDKLLDFTAHQSVNTNPSTHIGVCS